MHLSKLGIFAAFSFLGASLFAPSAFANSTFIPYFAGNVGIGVVTPEAALAIAEAASPYIQINTTSAANKRAAIMFLSQGSGQFEMGVDAAANNTKNFYLYDDASTAYRLAIDPSGNVGIGTYTPTAFLHIYNSSHGGDIGIGQQSDVTPYMRIGMDSGYTQYIANNAYWTGSAYNYVNTGGYGGLATRIAQVSGTIEFDTTSGGGNPISWSNRMYITNAGNVGIGSAAPAYKLDVGTSAMSAGSYYVTSGGGFYYSSDRSLKENIETSEGLELVKRLRGVSFDWKKTGNHDYGVIAQEVEEVLPELVSQNPQTHLRSVKYGSFTGILIEAVKDLARENEDQKKDIADLKARVEKLEAKFGQ